MTATKERRVRYDKFVLKYKNLTYQKHNALIELDFEPSKLILVAVLILDIVANP